MSRHLWWSDILSGRSQSRGLDSLRFTAAPSYPFEQLKSSFKCRCSLRLQQSFLHLRLGTSRVPKAIPNPFYQPCGIRPELPANAQILRQCFPLIIISNDSFRVDAEQPKLLCLSCLSPHLHSERVPPQSCRKGSRRKYRAYILDPSIVGRLHPGSSRIAGLAETR